MAQEEQLKTFSNLYFSISSKELYSAINNKAVGLDSISNCLLKLFNSILTNGSYPTNWKKAYLSPIHKGGTLDNPNNYRGIHVSILSCVAKLLNTILTKRLDDFLNNHNLINPVQIGFTKKARTSDHMFVLRTLIEKYTKDKNGKLFACFIDFRKAFDRVIHDIMLYKLLRIGIAGNFYTVIKDMFVGNHLNVRMKNGFTQSFLSIIGVRQGDTLNPDLFKIFINGLPDIFDDSCHGVDMGSYHLNCLLYADDVILLSQNEVGLQKCLKKLESYCADWCLEVNLDKTKILVFNKTGKLYKHEFKFTGETLDCVREYKYLGVKGIFKLKSIFSSTYPKSSVVFHIFDHTIKPILTYGCEIWASMSKTVRTTENILDCLYQKSSRRKAAY